MHLTQSPSSAGRNGLVIARAIAGSLLLLVLPSCGIPSLRKAEPPPGMPESFNGATTQDNSSQLKIEEFYHDPTLTCLIDLAVANNRELKGLNEEIQVASNEVLTRSGAYLPFVSIGALAGLDRASRFTESGAGIVSDPYLPGRFFSLTHGNFNTGINFTWQLDIYRQLRNARDAAGQRLNVHRRAAKLLRDDPGGRGRGELLPPDGPRQADREPEPDHRTPAAEPRNRQGLEGGREDHRAGRPPVPGRGRQEPEREADRQPGHRRHREPHQLPGQPLPSARRSRLRGVL